MCGLIAEVHVHSTIFCSDLLPFSPFADDIFNVATMIISVIYRVENIVGKGESAGYQHFLLFP